MARKTWKILDQVSPLGKSDDKLSRLDNGSTCQSTVAPSSVLGEHHILTACEARNKSLGHRT